MCQFLAGPTKDPKIPTSTKPHCHIAVTTSDQKTHEVVWVGYPTTAIGSNAVSLNGKGESARSYTVTTQRNM